MFDDKVEVEVHRRVKQDECVGRPPTEQVPNLPSGHPRLDQPGDLLALVLFEAVAGEDGLGPRPGRGELRSGEIDPPVRAGHLQPEGRRGFPVVQAPFPIQGTGDVQPEGELSAALVRVKVLSDMRLIVLAAVVPPPPGVSMSSGWGNDGSSSSTTPVGGPTPGASRANQHTNAIARLLPVSATTPPVAASNRTRPP